jgi:hypothetical protein
MTAVNNITLLGFLNTYRFEQSVTGNIQDDCCKFVFIKDDTLNKDLKTVINDAGYAIS